MISDFKHALRSLLKAPGFTAIAVLTLALGIGATTTIFSVVNTVLLRPLPYVQPERLARIYTEFPGYPNGGLQRFVISKAEYFDLKQGARLWDSIEGWVDSGVNIATSAEPIRVTGSFVTGGMLRALGIPAVLGRVINQQDDEPGAARVAVISYGLWQRTFAGERSILGRDVFLNGLKCTIVGVMPKGFQFPLGQANASEIWAPLQLDRTNPGERSAHSLNLLGRLDKGVTLHQVQAELDLLVQHWGQTGAGHRFEPKNHTLVTYGLHDEVVRTVRPALQMLFAAVCFLLLIACVNVANLLLARAEARQREIAIRGALGAGFWRLARQFAAEGILLSSVGAAAGLLLTSAGLTLIKFFTEGSIPRSTEMEIDATVLLFTLAVVLLTGLAFGLAPLIHVVGKNLHGSMKSAAVSTTDTTHARQFRHALVVSQLALALILLTGTGLMLRVFWKLQHVDAGFDPKAIVTTFVALPQATYPGRAAPQFWAQLTERLNALPDVGGAALATDLPPLQRANYTDTAIEGLAPTREGPFQSVDYYKIVSQSYFEVLRIRLLEGRFFDSRDGAEAAPVAIVNQTMAHTFWGNESAVGRRIRPGFFSTWFTVVGVVDDAKNGGLEKPTGTEAYLPYTQIPMQGDFDFLGGLYIAARSKGDSAHVMGEIRKQVSSIDSALPLAKFRTMDELTAQSQARPRLLTLLLSLFAGVALVLAAVGIYGVMSYSVAQRTKELGIRMALGAQHHSVVRLVLGRGLPLTIGGIVIGLIGAFALTRFLSGFLFGVTATDPATFVVMSLLLGAIAILASYIPARRATRVDPLVALRAE
jgi:predicted permease